MATSRSSWNWSRADDLLTVMLDWRESINKKS
jgi:hypothetical protein